MFAKKHHATRHSVSGDTRTHIAILVNVGRLSNPTGFTALQIGGPFYRMATRISEQPGMVGKRLVAVIMNKSPIPDFTEQNISECGDRPRKKCYNLDAVLSVDEYRAILNDNSSTSEQIKQRVGYLEAFCRNVIRLELEKYAE